MSNKRLYCVHCLRPKDGNQCCGNDSFETWEGISGTMDDDLFPALDVDMIDEYSDLFVGKLDKP